jgi:hypothetical protein
MHASFTCGVACLLLAGFALAASPPATEEATKLKATYTQKLQAYTQECNTAKAAVWDRYRKTLDALRLEAKQKGDLDAVQATDAELRRFEKQKFLPSGASRPANPDLAKAVRLCRDAMDKTEQDGAQKVIDLTDRYAQLLDQRVKQAVRDDKLDLAKAFDAEMKAARETPAYQAAKFLIADQDTAAVVKRESSDAPPSTAAPDKAPVAAVTTNAPPPVLAPARIGKNGEKIQPRVDPEGLYDAQRIFEGPPPTAIGTLSSYKQVAATETGKAPLTGSVGILLDGILDGENARYQLRFKLRTKTADATFTNLKVLAQYFIKNANNGSIQEARLQFALIQALDAKSVTCEMKPADLHTDRFSDYTVRHRNRFFVAEREGSFAGVVVSVFSSDDKLLVQVASANALKDQGRTAFELPAVWLEKIWNTTSESQPDAPPRPYREPRAPANDN